MITRDELNKILAKQRYKANKRAERQEKNGDPFGAIMTLIVNQITENCALIAYNEAKEKQEQKYNINSDFVAFGGWNEKYGYVYTKRRKP